MRQGGSAAALPRVTPYRDYLAFIARQDRAAALAAWRDSLAGARGGHAACGAAAANRARRRLRRSGSRCAGIELPLGAALTRAHRAAREQALTLTRCCRRRGACCSAG